MMRSPFFVVCNGRRINSGYIREEKQHFKAIHFLKSFASSTDVQVNFQQKDNPKKGRDPPTTQAGTAVARSSCPRGASRAQGAGAAKIR
jgi:hypothetical protein